MELLENRLTEAHQQEAESRLDAIRAKAEKASERGVALIRQDYTRQAKALAKTLAKLAAIDMLISEANRELDRGGREDLVESPNATRCRWNEYVTVTVQRTVGIGQPEHPGYGKHFPSSSVNSFAGREFVTFRDGTSMPRFMEIDVEERQLLPGIRQDPLWEAIQLPCPLLEGEPIWSKDFAMCDDFSSDLNINTEVAD